MLKTKDNPTTVPVSTIGANTPRVTLTDTERRAFADQMRRDYRPTPEPEPVPRVTVTRLKGVRDRRKTPVAPMAPEEQVHSCHGGFSSDRDLWIWQPIGTATSGPMELTEVPIEVALAEALRDNGCEDAHALTTLRLGKVQFLGMIGDGKKGCTTCAQSLAEVYGTLHAQGFSGKPDHPDFRRTVYRLMIDTGDAETNHRKALGHIKRAHKIKTKAVRNPQQDGREVVYSHFQMRGSRPVHHAALEEMITADWANSRSYGKDDAVKWRSGWTAELHPNRKITPSRATVAHRDAKEAAQQSPEDRQEWAERRAKQREQEYQASYDPDVLDVRCDWRDLADKYGLWIKDRFGQKTTKYRVPIPGRDPLEACIRIFADVDRACRAQGRERRPSFWWPEVDLRAKWPETLLWLEDGG